MVEREHRQIERDLPQTLDVEFDLQGQIGSFVQVNITIVTECISIAAACLSLWRDMNVVGSMSIYARRRGNQGRIAVAEDRTHKVEDRLIRISLVIRAGCTDPPAIDNLFSRVVLPDLCAIADRNGPDRGLCNGGLQHKRATFIRWNIPKLACKRAVKRGAFKR